MSQKAFSKPVKTCSKCGQTKPLDMFYKDNGSPDKKAYWCKECMAKRQKELKKLEEKNRAEKVVEPTASKQVAKRENLILTIDFNGHSDLYEWLAESAQKEFRTTEMQMLYCLTIRKELANGKGN